MEAIQDWLSPLLWFAGAVTTLVLLFKTLKPLITLFSSPKDLENKIEAMTKRFDERNQQIENNFQVINEKLNNQNQTLEAILKRNALEDSITLSLLHDSIVQIYQEAKRTGTISEVSYYRACELYKQNGHSEYIDSIMENLKEMHLKESDD